MKRMAALSLAASMALAFLTINSCDSKPTGKDDTDVGAGTTANKVRETPPANTTAKPTDETDTKTEATKREE